MNFNKLLRARLQALLFLFFETELISFDLTESYDLLRNWSLTLYIGKLYNYLMKVKIFCNLGSMVHSV
ncbi:hypothetical protein Calkr_0319 [Caldicellulosiruptor acetigenus I77R1B]|jgi:hypothetical protein|uniref:Uncharacterized protein n=2 Tax=Caldicellulosiruptor acetigenus TaxID=301953 RepID=G2PVK5_9FIRM|nr:hypothetical protein Calkr_0319 [Caldicellulosiruptor acetigenus I77R1B]AEM74605.1 hypothetical protein Calla_2038 [Caldicellulosiruptor acetigenus 6A]